MKHLSTFILFSLFSFASFAQGTIISLSVLPENPTVNDNIEVHAELMFSSSDCATDNQAHVVDGFDISASALHCIGMLTAICDATDVFQLGQLPEGLYTFHLSLSSGFGQAGCTAGIVPDDNDLFTFNVSGSVGIDEALKEDVLLYPTPTRDLLNFSQALSESCGIFNSTGQQVMSPPNGTRQVDISALDAGVYVLKSEGSRHRIIKI